MISSSPSSRLSGPWWTAVVAGLASYIDAAAIVSTGIALTIYRTVLGISPEQVGIASSALTLSIALGALVGGRIGDLLGRKKVFIATMILIIAGASILVTGSGFTTILVGVIIIGVGTGADLPVSLATVAEAAESARRGKLVSFSQILWLAGIVVTQLMGTFVGDLGLRGAQLLYIHVGVVSLLVLCARLTLPESAAWRAARDARRAGAELPSATRGRVTDLFRSPYVVPFVALLAFYILTNVVANTNGQFGTYLFVQAGGTTVSFASLFSMLATLGGVLFSLLFMQIVDTRHRMTFYVIGAVVGVVGMLIPAVFGVTLTTLIIQKICFSAIFNVFAFEAIMKVWTQETFPTLVRTTAQGSIIFMGRVSAALMATITPGLVEFAPQAMFALLAVLCLAGTTIGFVVFRRRRPAPAVSDPSLSIPETAR